MGERTLRLAALAAFALTGLGAVAASHDAAACSCMPPRLRVLGPSQVDNVPLNAHVRLEAPAAMASATTKAGDDGRLVLRVHEGAEVPVRVVASPDGMLSLVELVPERPLAPQTTYELALVERPSAPSTRVLAAFKTGAADDRTAPTVEGTAAVTAYATPNAASAACQVSGPSLRVTGLSARDPGRSGGQLLWAVWLPDASGKLDTAKAPWALRDTDEHERSIRIGRTSMCDFHSRGLPPGPVLDVAVAAVDEAGNTSAPRRFKVDLRTARRP